MKSNPFRISISAVIFFSFLSCISYGAESKMIKLDAPRTSGGKPLMDALKFRSSSRTFGPGNLNSQMLSNMLWAACGINRADSGKRTAPSAMNNQEIDIYVATADGLYLYDAKAHALKEVLAKDIRAMTGVQPYVKDAALDLIYVADFAKMGSMKEADKVLFSAAATGFIGQNVYLFCASEGLSTIIRAAIDKPALAKIMGLKPEQRIILSQSVGYPKK